MKRVGISPGRRAFLRSVASAGSAAVAISAGVQLAMGMTCTVTLPPGAAHSSAAGAHGVAF
jgi:hypothetical protein